MISGVIYRIFHFASQKMSEESIKIAVLEQKLIDFANIVTKIDDAITKISDVNANITKMLAVHEEKIDQCNKSDVLIIKMIDNIKSENSKDNKEYNQRIEELETKVDEMSKFKWMVAGIVSIFVFIAPILTSYIPSIFQQNQVQKNR